TNPVPVEDLLTLEAALARLEAEDARSAQVVALRFFAGMSTPEVAEHLNVSVRTVEADWTFARAWLRRELAGEKTDEGGDPRRELRSIRGVVFRASGLVPRGPPAQATDRRRRRARLRETGRTPALRRLYPAQGLRLARRRGSPAGTATSREPRRDGRGSRRTP